MLAGPGPVGRVDRLTRSGFAVAAVALPLDHAIDLAAGETRVIDGLAAYAAVRDGDPLPLALDALAAAAADGALFDGQRSWFDRFWRDAGLALADAGAAQALRHGLFQLVQAAGRDGSASLAAKGQTGEGYEGHVFWDAEIYALPVFVYLAPATARAMLQWRIDRLDAARANARLMGHGRGALYPWRTIGGAECSSFFPAGAAQYHINADIAHALQLYVMTTGDRSILADGGAAMLAETARIWLQVGFHDPARDDAFVINRITGPDEYSALVDNNLYTNLMAAAHLRFAADAGEVGAEEAAAMRRAADRMVLAHDAARDVPAQDDGIFALQPWPFDRTPPGDYPLLLHHHPLTLYRYRVAKQADAVLARRCGPTASMSPPAAACSMCTKRSPSTIRRCRRARLRSWRRRRAKPRVPPPIGGPRCSPISPTCSATAGTACTWRRWPAAGRRWRSASPGCGRWTGGCTSRRRGAARDRRLCAAGPLPGPAGAGSR